MTRYGMVIDLDRCIGCHACTLACKATNNTPPGVFFNRVEDREVGEFPDVKRFFLPRICLHCQEAPCLEACPSGATYHAENGAVVVDISKCVGCKACMLACPYGVRYSYFEGQDGSAYFEATAVPPPEDAEEIVQKCHLCFERTREGKKPACVLTCLTAARHYGDLDDPHSEVSRLIREKSGWTILEELGTGPSVYYIGRIPLPQEKIWELLV